MRSRLLLLLGGFATGALGTALLGAGCGHEVRLTDEDDLGGGGAGSGSGGGGVTKPSGSGTGLVPIPEGGLPDYVDPGCPEPTPPVFDFVCDPYTQHNGDCPAGEGCFIYVDYPDEPCDAEVYGSFCAIEGSGTQGDPCGGGGDCSGGFICVVTGAGNQCVELCSLVGDDGCPAGLVCEPIDVKGFGGCL